MNTKPCQHIGIAYLGEMSPMYVGPLFKCSDCGQEWRLWDVRAALHQNVEMTGVLKDIANLDNIWCDPVTMANETLTALGLVAASEPPQPAGTGGE